MAYAGPPLEALALAGFGGTLISARGRESLVRVDQESDLNRVLDAVKGSGGTLISVSPRRETLEDLYLREVAAR